MTARPSLWRWVAVAGAAAVVLVSAAGAALLWRERERMRHLALPVLAEPPAAEPGAPPVEPEVVGPCRAEEVARVGARVAALLTASDGALWIGTFDAGVIRLAPGEPPRAVEGLEGRRRFVNALAQHGGVVWAATQGGLLALDDDLPAERGVLLADEGVTALAVAGGSLHAGTARGIFRVGGGAVEAVPVSGPSGEPLRVTALAVAPKGAGRGGGRLWIGTASGAYSLPLATLTAPLLSRTAAWHPLVFGEPPAETNVVTALVAASGGAIAGTDDGGLVSIGEDGRVAAVRLADPRANEVNPGAAVATGPGAAFGTQGGGVLLARSRGGALVLARPEGLERAAVSAVAVDGPILLVGTADGAVLRLACPPGGDVG